MRSLLKKLPYLGKLRDQHVTFGRFSVRLPPGHLLPVYQRKHPSYDRFLPLLAGHLQAGSTVIDIGANCGDTVAAMAAQNPHLYYLCVEPDEVFHRYLQSNITLMQTVAPDLRIEAVMAMVGKEVTNAGLAGSGGTKHALPGAGALAATSLDEISLTGDRPPVRLLKSDVDGFDYDVINSASELIRRDRPLLFYECQFFDETQRTGFENLMASLGEAGYMRWTLFDNFGEVMLSDTSPAQIKQLMAYAWRQNQKRATRTVYYYDVLAAVPADAALVDRVLGEYGADAAV